MRPILIFFILLAMVSPVYASNDFFAYADSKSSACSCGGFSEARVFITNGDFENLFVLEVDGSASSFVSIYPSTFLLKPHETVVVSEFFSPPCVEGGYDLVLNLRTDTNLVKVLRQQFVSSYCDNINVSMVYRNDSGCRCNLFSYVFNVTNTGKYAEDYSFYADGFSRYVSISPKAVRIGSGGSNLSFLYFLPDCSVGSASFDFVVKAEKSGFVQQFPVYPFINSSCFGTFKRSYSFSNYLLDSLAYFPFVILLLILVFVVVRLLRGKRERVEEKLIEKKAYPWEKKFRLKEKPVRKFSKLGILLVLVASLVVLFFVFSLFSKITGDFGSVNISMPSFNFSSTGFNVSQSVVSNESSSAVSSLFRPVRVFLSVYYVYAVAGFLLLVLAILAIEIFRMRRSNAD